MHHLQNMTWKEIRGSAKEGATAILPLGSTEQHGSHLPVKTDTCLVDSVAGAAAGALDNEVPIVLAPTLWLGASHHHQKFFALSLSESTYINVLDEMIMSFELAGFRRLFVLNGHGGNGSPLRVALSGIKRRNISMLVAAAEYWSLAGTVIGEIRKSGPGGAAHAGEIETSLMMRVDNEQVRADLVESSVPEMPPGFEIDLIQGGPISLSSSWESVAPDGHIGDAVVASAETGDRLFSAIVTAVSNALKTFHNMDIPE